MVASTRSWTQTNRKLAGDLRYLSQTALLQERYTPRVIRLAMLCISGAIVCFIGWAAITQINEVARTKGNVVPDGYLQMVQHAEGGIISSIMAKEGELVEKGQVLLTLDPKDPVRDLREMRSRKVALQLQAERMNALIHGREPDFDAIEGTTATLIRAQERLIDDMRAAHQQEKEIISAQIEQKKQALAALESRYRTLGQTLSLVNEERRMQETLLAQGLTSRLRFLDKKKEHTSVWGEYEATRSQMQEAKQAIAEYEERLASLDAASREQLQRQLEAIENELTQHEEVLGKQANRMDRLTIRSPVYGLIKGLEVNTVGGVIGAGQTLMQIVPLHAPLVVETRISPKDIGYAITGSPVQVKVHAFDYTRFGSIEGVLEFVSATTFVDEQNQSYYRGRVKLEKNHVGADPTRNIVLPGMTVDAEIITGRKSVLDYLLKPIQAAASTAFTER